MQKISIDEVVDKLIGSIVPVGDVYEDEIIEENLSNYVELLSNMFDNVISIARQNGDSRNSVNKIANKAHKFIHYATLELNDYVKDNPLNKTE